MKWLRLWHDMPTDPKWRAISRRSGQPIPNVIAVYIFIMINASANDLNRGTLNNWNSEDVAAALDISAESVQAIVDAMDGKVLNGLALTGWDRRQPKREDPGNTQRTRLYRERETQRNATKRSETLEQSRLEQNITETAAADAIGRFPQAAAAITNTFPSTDGAMINKLLNLAIATLPDIQDDWIVEALIDTLKSKKGSQRSAALWEYTLPPYLAARAATFRDSRPEPSASLGDAAYTAKTPEERVAHLRLLLGIAGVADGPIKTTWQAELDTLLQEPVCRKPPHAQTFANKAAQKS